MEFFSFDEEYLNRLIDGHRETEHHFIEYFSVLLRAKLMSRLRCTQDIEDLTQEVFLRVLQFLRNGSELKHAGKLGAFVNAVCNNVLFEHARTKSRTAPWEDGKAELTDSGDDLEREFLSEEVCYQVRVVLDGMPAKDSDLLRAVFLEERDRDTVCRDFGVRRAYLRVLLHRARCRLRSLLASPESADRAGRGTAQGTKE